MLCLFYLFPKGLWPAVFSCKKPWHSKAWNLHTFTKATRLEKNVGNDLIVGTRNLRSVIVLGFCEKLASQNYNIVN